MTTLPLFIFVGAFIETAGYELLACWLLTATSASFSLSLSLSLSALQAIYNRMKQQYDYEW